MWFQNIKRKFLNESLFQIFNDYLGSLDKNKRERQFILQSNYQFVCNCVACKEDWPTANGYLSLNVSTYQQQMK